MLLFDSDEEDDDDSGFCMLYPIVSLEYMDNMCFILPLLLLLMFLLMVADGLPLDTFVMLLVVVQVCVLDDVNIILEDFLGTKIKAEDE